MALPRTPLALGLVALGALALSGCTKPAPGASVWSGTSSDHQPATCWSWDSAAKVDVKQCLQGGDTIGTVVAAPSSTIGISVPPEVADNGWFPAIGDQRLTTRPVTSTYYRFALSEQNLQKPLELRVLALADDGTSVRGLWFFELKPAR